MCPKGQLPALEAARLILSPAPTLTYGRAMSGSVRATHDAVDRVGDAPARGPTRETASRVAGGPGRVLALQRTAGNAAVTKAMSADALVFTQRQTPPAPSSGGPAPAPPSAPVGKRTGRPIADLEKEFRDLIASARGAGYPVAADNLEHFLVGGGATKSVPLGWLRSYGVVSSAENTNHERFESQLDDKGKNLADGATDTLSDFWDAKISAWPFTELFYASGQSQLKSTGTFTLSRSGKIVTITGTVDQRWFDPYNWNPGSSAWIPGHGPVSDDVGLDLKDAGVGHDYMLENTYVQTLTGTYRFRRVIWNASTYLWDGP